MANSQWNSKHTKALCAFCGLRTLEDQSTMHGFTTKDVAHRLAIHPQTARKWLNYAVDYGIVVKHSRHIVGAAHEDVWFTFWSHVISDEKYIMLHQDLDVMSRLHAPERVPNL